MPATLKLWLTSQQCANLSLPAGSIGYVAWYDLDAGIDGWRGAAQITTDVSQAIRWPTKPEALEAWREQSTKHPVRPYDGQPNRPLSAYSAELIDVD